jgi:hypothetical protein
MLQRLDGVRLMEQNLQDVLDNFQRQFLAEIGNARPVQPPVPDEALLNRPEAGRRYNVHFYGGGIHRLLTRSFTKYPWILVTNVQFSRI